MAISSYILSSFFILPFVLAMGSSPSLSCPCTRESEIRMVLYMRQVNEGQPNANGVRRPTSLRLPFGFGDVFVNDWVILDAPEPNANVVADARGINVNADQAAGAGYHSSLSVVFKAGRFKGSTLELLGIHAAEAAWAVVGGTGQFSFARGTINYRIVKNVPGAEEYKELSIHALYIPPAGNATTGTADQ